MVNLLFRVLVDEVFCDKSPGDGYVGHGNCKDLQEVHLVAIEDGECL